MESISRSIILRQDSVKVVRSNSTTHDRPRSGSFGKVIKLDWNGTICAGKFLYAANFEEDNEEEYMKAFRKEINLWKSISHPHVVQLHGIWINPHSDLPYMVMELLKCSLFQYLQDKRSKIQFKTKLRILCDVAKGLVYLHEDKHFAHRDLTAPNILLTSNLVAKIGDFGQSRLIEGQTDQLTNCPGNASFMPPEALQMHPQMDPQYDLSIDCFSYGCVTLHTIVEEFPVPLPFERSDDSMPGRILNEAERRKKWMDKIEDTNPLKQLICQCLENDKAKRPKAFDILSAIRDIIGVEGNDAPDDAIALTSSYHVDNDTTTPTSITSADYNQLSQGASTDHVKPFSHHKETVASPTRQSVNTVSGRPSFCPHECTSINIEVVNRTIVYKPYWKCDECCKGQSKASSVVEYICLKCGYQTCGVQHSREHFKVTDHKLSLFTQQLQSNSVWCFACKNKIKTKSNVSNLKEQLETQHRILLHESDVIKKFNVPSHNSQTNACWICQQRFGYIFKRPVKCVVCLRDFCNQHVTNQVCRLCKSISDMKLNEASVDARKRTEYIPIKGINNLGNTSSLSVVLQNILRFPEVVTTIIKRSDNSVPLVPMGSRSLVEELDDIVKQCHNADTLHVMPSELYKLLNDQVKGTDNGVITMWFALMSSLKKEQTVAANVPGGIDTITDHFTAKIKHITWCGKCNSTNEISQDEYYLLLSLHNDKELNLVVDYEKYRAEAENCSKYPYQLSGKEIAENSLEKCLLNYIAVYKSDSENEAICTPCSLRQDGTNVITSFSRQYLIEKLPKILLLHLGRDDDKGRVDDRHISFPLILDIAPYCCNTENSDKKHQILYCLNGVVLQNLKSRNRHYTTYVRDKCSPLPTIQNELTKLKATSDKYCVNTAYSGTWFYIDDCAITPVSLKEVMNCQAYILFYEEL